MSRLDNLTQLGLCQKNGNGNEKSCVNVKNFKNKFSDQKHFKQSDISCFRYLQNALKQKQIVFFHFQCKYEQ